MEPEIRASLLRAYLERLRALGADDLEAALAELGDEAARRIHGTAGHEWLPGAYEIAILRSVERRRGEDGVRQIGRDIGRSALENAILRPLVSATLGMLGRRPEALIQVIMAGLYVATRNGGRARIVSRENGGVRMLYSAIPEAWRERVLLVKYCGSMEAVLAHGGVRGRVELEWTRGEPSAIYRVSWERGAAA